MAPKLKTSPTHSVTKVTEATIVSTEVLMNRNEYYLSFSDEPVSYTIGAEEYFTPGQLNFKDKQMTNLTYFKYYHVRNEEIWILK